MIHSACTIHLLNLPEKTAKRDLNHGLRHLEEIAEDWLCARRTLSILSVLARKWRCELPEDAEMILKRTDERFEYYSTSEVPSPGSSSNVAPTSPGISEEGTAGTAAAARLEYAQMRHQNSEPIAQMRHQNSEPIAQPALQTSIEERLSMDSPMSLTNGNPLSGQQVMAMDPTQMDFQEILNAWPQQLNMPLNSQSPDLSPPAQSQLSSNMSHNPSQHLNIDSREWLLNDSARLHQSFGSWNMRQQQQQQPQRPPTTSAMSSAMFMFSSGQADGATIEAPDLSNFDSLSESLTTINTWLPPGLE